MSVQSTLTSFYSARKRGSVEEIKKHTKVRIIDGCNSESNCVDADDHGQVLFLHKTKEFLESEISQEVKSTILSKFEDKSHSSTNIIKSTKKSRVKLDIQRTKNTPLKPLKSSRQKSLRDVFANLGDRSNEANKADLLNVLNAKPVQDHQRESASQPKEPVGNSNPPVDNKEKNEEDDKTGGHHEAQSIHPKRRPVTFEKKGNLSPCKVNDTKRLLFKPATSGENAVSAKERHSESQEKNKQASSSAASGTFVKMSRKELSLGDIRGRLKGNSRLAELRESLARVSSCAAKIREADREKDLGSSPSLKKFQSIEFEVPVVCSPKKSMLASPCKTPPSSPVPAYQRYAHLTSPLRVPLSPSKTSVASPSKSSPLGLPYQYRCLAEVFRCVDVVAAMMMNRKEQISLNKLRPAVQEMLRRNMTERHLGQIKKVFPEAFEFHYKKVNQLTVSSAKAERYELIIKPVLKSKESEGTYEKKSEDISKSEGKSNSMTPSVLLERRHKFHRSLLEIVKDHHEEFLRSLDPPMVVPREKLTRWHPAFEVELLPEVEPSEMPLPPDAPEKCSSAKDVLSRARNLFGCNSRMERALEKVSMADSKEEGDKRDEEQGSSSSTSAEIAPFTNPALKGIPLALLKKVRERQAAKALVTMTMSPAEEKQAERLSRLPELARILRGIFVSERKGVLSLEFVIKKLGDSYRANLNATELEEHVKLLETSVPGWATRFSIRHSQYIKLARDADLSRVISKLEKLASDAKR